MKIRSKLHRIYHQSIRRDKVYTYYDLCKKSQHWTLKELRDYQYQLLSKLLKDAYIDVPYYRSLFDSIGMKPADFVDLESIKKLPILTKEIIRSHHRELLSAKQSPSNSRSNSTSGSTGQSLHFRSPKHCEHHVALSMRCFDWMGIGFDDLKYRIWGTPFNHKPKNNTRFKMFAERNLVVSGYNLSEDDLIRILSDLARLKPAIVISYPSILEHIAHYCEKKKLGVKINKIQIGGEKLFPHQRRLFQNAFGAEVFDFYGARDIPRIAQECEFHNGLHVMAENVIVEVMDDSGEIVNEGEGDLIITDLHNWVMPFIRYKIGDRVRVSTRRCECGRELPLIEEVMGRSFDLISFPNGNSVMGTFWPLLLKSKPGIEQFTVHQVATNRIVIKYIGDKKAVEAVSEYWTNEIHKKSGPALEVNYQQVSELPSSSAGKHKFVIKEI